jgi:transcriptional regulator with PAS, ATPase and Fis domain
MTMCSDSPTDPTSPFLRQIQQDLECAIRSDARVLITGPGGARTAALAELIHRNSPRSLRRFLTVNCAAMPDALLEAKLFGHVLGSVHSTERDPRGLLEQAHGGTIFMANIGAIGHGLQSRLLQFLEHREIRRVGADVPHTKVDVRVMASADRHLFERTERNAFRQDLYYRLNVIHLIVPPARRQHDDPSPAAGQ